MGDPGTVTAAKLRDQAAALGVDQVQDVTVLGGAAYTAAAAAIWPHARLPLTGTGGMGEQLARLAEITRTGSAV